MFCRICIMDHFHPLTVRSWGTCQCLFFTVTLLLLCDLSSSDNDQPPAVIPQEVFAQGHSVKRGSYQGRESAKKKKKTAATFNLSCLTLRSAVVQFEEDSTVWEMTENRSWLIPYKFISGLFSRLMFFSLKYQKIVKNIHYKFLEYNVASLNDFCKNNNAKPRYIQMTEKLENVHL